MLTMRTTIPCLVALLLLSACALRAPKTNAVVILTAHKSEAIPQTNTLYRIAPPALYQTRLPGTKEVAASLARSLANEFVFRTGLRNTYHLPCTTARHQQCGTIVSFNSKDCKKQLHVFVAYDQTIELRNTTQPSPGAYSSKAADGLPGNAQE